MPSLVLVLSPPIGLSPKDFPSRKPISRPKGLASREGVARGPKRLLNGGRNLKLQRGSCLIPDERFPSLPAIQKHGAPGRGEDETEEEEEEDLSSSSSDSEGSDEEYGVGRGVHGQGGVAQAQLEWDDSTLPY